MDVVTPSAKKSETVKPVSRSGLNIEPTKPVVAPEPVTSAPISPSTAPKETETSSPVKEASPSTSEQPTSKSDWPDPLEVANFTGQEKTNPTEPTQNTVSSSSAAPLAQTDKATTADAESLAEPPLTTPFLPDTKVEKRPLGANAADIAKSGQEPATTPAKSEIMTEDPAAQLPATSEDVKPVLPEELHSDLVAIESDTTEPEVAEDTQKDDLQTEEKASVKDTITSEPPKVPPKEAEPSVKSGATSIPQQYREESTSGEQKNGAIYDTETYHKPLAHPAKQKSGWMWVIWILLILLVGAGGGAALYFLGIYKF